MPAAVLFHRVARPGALGQEGQEAVEAAAEAGFKFPGVQALHSAQTQHQPFRVPVQGRNPLTFREQRHVVLHTVNIALQVLFVGIAHAAEVGMGTGAKSRVFLQRPVFQVVPGLPARPGKVGDFILGIAVLGKILHGIQIHVRLGFIVGQIFLRLPGIEGSARFHLQPIAAQVLRRQGHGGGKVFLPLLRTLAGETVNEIQGEVFKPGFPGGFHGCGDLRHGMYPADVLEFCVAGGLHAQGQPVESGLAQRLECFPVAGGFRVGFQGDLRVLGHVIPLADGFEQGGQALDTQKAGGAAAEIDGVDLMRGGGGCGFRQVGTQGVHIIIHPGILAGQGVKVAIGTLLPAEGNMKIQPQGARRNMHRCDPPIH